MHFILVLWATLPPLLGKNARLRENLDTTFGLNADLYWLAVSFLSNNSCAVESVLSTIQRGFVRNAQQRLH